MAKQDAKERKQRPAVVPEVPLLGELAEFREALRAEVEASKRASASNAVGLSDGRLIATIAGAFQYQFNMESALDLPGDAPGELRVSGQDPLRVTIVSIEGLTLTLSIERSLGKFVPRATLQSNLSMLLLKLIERIETKSTVANPAGDRLLGKTPPSGDAEPVNNGALALANQQVLNKEQLAAVGSALGRDTTYIWGPPGTGKTHTIGAIGAELLRRDKTVLVVSHTNVAVDGAIIKIADAVRAFDSEMIENGGIIRVGNPSPRWRGRDEDQALMLAEQARRRSAELAERQRSLRAERQLLVPRESYLNQLIELHEFLPDAEADIARFRASHARLLELGRQRQRLQIDVQAAADRAAEHAPVEQSAQAAAWALEHRGECRQRWEQLNSQLTTMRPQLAQLERDAQAAEQDFQAAAKVQPFRDQLRKRRSVMEASQFVETALQRRMTTAAEVQRLTGELREAQRVLQETTIVNFITRKWRGLPSPEAQEKAVTELTSRLRSAESTLAQLSDLHARAVDEIAYTERLVAALAPHAHIGTPTEQQARVLRCKRVCDRLRVTLKKVEATFAETDVEWRAIEEAITAFQKAGHGDPQSVLRTIAQTTVRLTQLRASLRDVMILEQEEAETLEAELSPPLQMMAEQGYADGLNPESDLDEKLTALERSVARARKEASRTPLEQATEERAQIQNRFREIADELNMIEDALRRIEETVIRNAKVIGATLTASYLRDAIQNRRFDTVILDEASMAAIPALWIAASVCDRALVIIGDFKQLPPVVLADPEKQNGDPGAVLAKRWLGRDAFEIVKLNHDEPWPPHFAGLREQHRMLPPISCIVNELIYGGWLRDGESVTRPEHAVADWIPRDWPDEPVLLVDMGALNAWVTTVVRGTGGTASRLNFMSATVCTDIASALLSARMFDDGLSRAEGRSEPAVLLVSPYRPHTKLLNLMLADAGLNTMAKAGTVHSFQGSEADVVIFDLVNDEPARRVGLFAAKHDEGHRRLFNVAVTRAKKRLIIVGDFSFCRKNGKNAFLGKDLIPFLTKRYPVVDARELVPEGLAGRAAAAQMRVMGGLTPSSHEFQMVRQDDFYPMLHTDLQASRERVIIYSPFITQKRLSQLEPPLKAAVERGVDVYVVTKPLHERDPQDVRTYRELERTLVEWNVRVIHKQAMHEKLVLIDSDIVWVGSLNTLSFAKTQEIMWRFRSEKVFKECADSMQIGELLEQFGDGLAKCEIHGTELVIAEGMDSPVYFKCSTPGCIFRRAITDTSIRDGVVLCKRCDGDVRLELKGHDGKPRWICKTDPKHTRLVKLMHLQLPKMRAQIKPSDL